MGIRHALRVGDRAWDLHDARGMVQDLVAICARRGAAAAAALGASCVEEVQQSWGGDDFAWFTREVPGAYVRLGVRDPHGPTLDLHAGHFDVDERSIAIGVQLLTATVERFFAGPAEA